MFENFISIYVCKRYSIFRHFERVQVIFQGFKLPKDVDSTQLMYDLQCQATSKTCYKLFLITLSTFTSIS